MQQPTGLAKDLRALLALDLQGGGLGWRLRARDAVMTAAFGLGGTLSGIGYDPLVLIYGLTQAVACKFVRPNATSAK